MVVFVAIVPDVLCRGSTLAPRWVAPLIVGGLMLGGCTDDEPDDGAPTSEASPTASPAPTAESPSAEPSITAPELPDEAREPTPEGAAAFVRYYLEVVTYGYVTGDTRPLEAAVSAECESCRALHEEITEGYANGGRIEGGRITVSEVSTTPGDVETGLLSLAVVDQEDSVFLSAEGSEISMIEGVEDELVQLLTVRAGETWEVREWGGYEPPAE